MKIRMFVTLLALFIGASPALAQETPKKKKLEAGNAMTKPISPNTPDTVVTPVAPNGLSNGLALGNQDFNYDVLANQDGSSRFFQTFNDGNFLGVSVEDITKDNFTKYNLREARGVGVVDVTKDSPAEKAGLKKGDVILKFDDEAVTNARKLNRLIEESSPQHQVDLRISRESKEQQMTATIGKRAGSTAAFSEFGRSKQLSADVRQRVQEELEQKLGKLRDQHKSFADANRVFNFTLGSSRRIGVNTSPLTKQLAEFFAVKSGAGLLITNVNETSPAAKAELKAGDVITAVDGEAITDIGSFYRAIGHKSDGEVNVTITRDKSEKTIKVTPEKQNMEFVGGPRARAIVPAQPLPMVLVMPQISIPAVPAVTIPSIDIKLPPLLRMPKIDILGGQPPDLRNPM